MTNIRKNQTKVCAPLNFAKFCLLNNLFHGNIWQKLPEIDINTFMKSSADVLLKEGKIKCAKISFDKSY